MTGPIAPAYQPWMDDAVCAQVDPELFFPEKNGNSAPARRLCGTCPIAGECLEYALTNREPHGVWGGLTPFERRKLLQPHNRSNDMLKGAVRRLNRAGLMDTEIGEQLGVSGGHVTRVRRGLGLPSNSAGGRRKTG